MSWRVVIISRVAKLDLKLGNLVIRSETNNKIHLSEISTLIIENTAVSLTAALLSELTKRKIKVIFCDPQRNPQAELMPYYGSHDTSAKIRQQIAWSKETKANIWTEIIHNKIYQQAIFLKKMQKQEAELLFTYIKALEHNDVSNREGHAAKVYFNALFGQSFARSNECVINAALNYGYAILLSAFNREIVSNGYITQIGIHHDNIYNQFNLASDLMEPFRPLVDSIAYTIENEEFKKEDKYKLVGVLNQQVLIDKQQHYVNNAIKIYCKSIFDALSNNDVSCIKFYTSISNNEIER